MITKVEDLHPADYNPRKISQRQMDSLAASLAEYGDLSGVIVNIRTGNLVGGHQRTKAFDPSWTIIKDAQTDATGTVSSGYVDTPWGRMGYREVDWDDAREKAANLAANKHGGEWDLQKLDIVIQELQAIDYELELTGFDVGEINRLEKYIEGPGNGDGSPGLDGYVYQVVVTVANDGAQKKLIEELEKRGMPCQPLML